MSDSEFTILKVPISATTNKILISSKLEKQHLWNILSIGSTESSIFDINHIYIRFKTHSSKSTISANKQNYFHFS